MHTPEAEIPAIPFPMRYNTKTTAHSLNAVCVSAGMPNHMILFLFVPPNRKLIQCTKSSTYCRLSSVAFQNYLILLASPQMLPKWLQPNLKQPEQNRKTIHIIPFSRHRPSLSFINYKNKNVFLSQLLAFSLQLRSQARSWLTAELQLTSGSINNNIKIETRGRGVPLMFGNPSQMFGRLRGSLRKLS